MSRKYIIKSAVQLVISTLIVIFAILCAMGIFGWFSMSRNVSGNGSVISTKDVSPLEIRASADGTDDISVDVATEDMYKFNSGKNTGFRPSAYGQFTFYVNDGSTEGSQSYNFHYSITVKNNEFHKEENETTYGLYPDVNTESEEFKKAEQYINSHIMFFTSKDENGVYSGWIRPDSPTKVSVDENDGSFPVPVYWVWVEHYSSIIEENSGLIEEETRKKIEEYYNENIGKLLADVKNKSAESYNIADTIIGMTYKCVCFEIKVTKD